MSRAAAARSREEARAGVAVRIAAASLGLLFLLALLAPFLANEFPLLVRSEEGLELPVLRAFGALDAFWTGAGLTLVVALLARALLRRLAPPRAGRRALLVLVLAMLGGTAAWTATAEPANLAAFDWSEDAMGDAGVVWPPLRHGWRDLDQRPEAALAAPGRLADHPLGTDRFGRDVLARLLFGARVSLLVGVLTVLLAAVVGVAIGAVAGYARGAVDALLSGVIQVFMCFPVLFTVIALQAFVPPSVLWIVLLLGLTRWTQPARLVRGEVLRLREEPFVLAARAQGLRAGEIVRRHLVPHALGPVIVNATFGVGTAILVESTLSFLGLGVPGLPSWGEMLSQGRNVLAEGPHLVWLPGLLIFLTVLGFQTLGEGVRRRLDPQGGGSGPRRRGA